MRRRKGNLSLFGGYSLIFARQFVAHFAGSGGQYHNIWFDGERYIRATAGVGIIILGLLIP